ncbi:MAG: 30S ribosomal protein S3 [Cytophagales bacterium]|nr:30S ribosomal protein S3 [Cytophagales bacterium]
MGQKVNPIGLRLGIIKEWESVWYGGRLFGDWLIEDHKIRKYIQSYVPQASISRIFIERMENRITIAIHTARAGIVIGKGGAEIDKLRDHLQKLTGREVKLNIMEIKRAETDAGLVADSVAQQLRARISHKRSMKQAISSAIRAGARGIKIKVSGRLGGAEMARSEKYKEGRIPLHTFRANIGYAFRESYTIYGKIGVKVWIYKGEIYQKWQDIRPESPSSGPSSSGWNRGNTWKTENRERRPE